MVKVSAAVAQIHQLTTMAEWWRCFAALVG
jgi:hypothetical protein